MFEEIKNDLAENFKQEDEAILKSIIERITNDALIISNRVKSKKNIDILSSDIKECVKAIYLQRGAEGSNSLSDSGINTSFNKPMQEMRENIVKAGKRIMFL